MARISHEALSAKHYKRNLATAFAGHSISHRVVLMPNLATNAKKDTTYVPSLVVSKLTASRTISDRQQAPRIPTLLIPFEAIRKQHFRAASSRNIFALKFSLERASSQLPYVQWASETVLVSM